VFFGFSVFWFDLNIKNQFHLHNQPNHHHRLLLMPFLVVYAGGIV
jgi:hypothetical protein